ncbi:uncharacterized protein LOC132255878 [Phlebotomus argentipes]|uniref:uncharacterized protein LOC132255878 n=1 Tax=Phlebotomus argentipes TaxID=94469 RepID=UPI00289361B4|nr:uncharacterized protein LOC132255878 [Phlebotomus argentipes]
MTNIRPIAPELVKIAKEELNEVPERISEDLEALREWIRKQPHLKARTDDQFLVTFFRGCKWSLERTKQKLDTFYTVRSALPELIHHRDPLEKRTLEVIRMGFVMPLPLTERPDGPRIMLFRPGVYNPTLHTIHEMIRVSLMVNDILLCTDDNRSIAGQIGIVDLAGATMAHLGQANVVLMKKFSMITQDASPLRQKGFHFVNAPSGFATVYNLAKGMFNEKMQQRFRVHTDRESLFKCIPKRLLPSEYGGEAGPIQKIIDDLEKDLIGARDFFREEDNFGTNEKRRIGRPKNAETLFGVEGSFRKLQVYWLTRCLRLIRLYPYSLAHFLLHEVPECSEGHLESCRCVEEVESLLAHRCRLVSQHGELLHQHRRELQEVLHGGVLHVHEHRLTGAHPVVVLRQLQIGNHQAHAQHVDDGELVRIVASVANENDTWTVRIKARAKMAKIRPLNRELEIVVREKLHEVPERIEKDLQALKDWLAKEPHLISRTDDQFLVAFLRNFKYSLEKSKEMIDNYYSVRSTIPEMRKDRDPVSEQNKAIIRTGYSLPMPNCPPGGSRIYLNRISVFDPNKFTIYEMLKVASMINDIAIMEDDNCVVAGHVDIIDLKGMTTAHYMTFTPTVLKKLIMIAQQATPLHQKEIHYLNLPSSMMTLFNMFKKQMIEKSGVKIHVHASLESLQSAIPLEFLPEEYGGTGGSLPDIIAGWEKKLAERRQWFLDDEKYGTDESKRKGTPRTAESLFGFEGSFRQLEFD